MRKTEYFTICEIIYTTLEYCTFYETYRTAINIWNFFITLEILLTLLFVNSNYKNCNFI